MVKRALKSACLCIFVLMLAIPALAQNTKGDRPQPSNRETRFKTPAKAPHKKKSRRIREKADRPAPRQALPPSRGRRGERAGRPIRPTFEKSKPDSKQKAWRGDVSGRRIKPRRAESRAWNVYRQPDYINYSSRSLNQRRRNNDNPNLKRVRKMMQRHERARAKPGKRIRPLYSNHKPRQREKAWKGDLTGRRIRSRQSENIPLVGGTHAPGERGGHRPRIQLRRLLPGAGPSRARNYTRRKFYVNNRSTTPSRLSGGGWIQGHSGEKRRQGGGKVIPRSASRAYLSRKSINVWARFARPGRRQGRASTRDLAGKKLRMRNFETQRPVLTNPTLKYQKRIPGGERPYEGHKGGFVTRRPGQKAWKGDVAHWPVRGGKSPGGRMLAGKRIPGQRPGLGANGIGKYRGTIKRNQRGGLGRQGADYAGNIRVRKRGKDPAGSGFTGNLRARRQGFNDQGEEYTGNIPMRKRRGFNRQGEGYSGHIKARRGFNDQGEAYSGNIKTRGRRGFNDQGEEYTGNIKVRRGYNDQGEEYSGNIRTRGKHRLNDQGEGYRGSIKARRGFNDQGEEYSGNIKSHGRRGFNYQGEEYTGNIKVRRGFNDQGEEYTGNIKAHRPDKGGGSVGRNLWNNNNSPIPVRVPKGQADIARYQGRMRVERRRFQEQGEEFSGNIKARRPEKGGGSVSGKLWNNHETPIEGNAPKHLQGGSFAGHIRLARNAYKRNPNSPPSALPVYREKHEQGGDYTGNVKFARNSYRRNPNSSRLALQVKKPVLAERGRLLNTRRNWDYVKNPSAADQSLRTREAGRAFGQSASYQGSIKIRKFDLFRKSDLHPDAQFVKLNKNNVPEEKDLITNFKLWWARLFRKNDTQPDYVKQKEGKPRYDKGEAGMWYE